MKLRKTTYELATAKWDRLRNFVIVQHQSCRKVTLLFNMSFSKKRHFV